MKNILVFKTSTDATMERLFHTLGDLGSIDCLIQASQIDRYRSIYPNVHFVDIEREGFYDLPTYVLEQIYGKEYDELYVTFSGISGYNYGNVMSIVEHVRSKACFFYNGNGERIAMPTMNRWKDFLLKCYIVLMDWIYRKRGK